MTMTPMDLKIKKLYRYESDEVKTIDSTTKQEELGKFKRDLVVTFLSEPKPFYEENGTVYVWVAELITQDGLFGQTFLTKKDSLNFKEVTIQPNT